MSFVSSPTRLKNTTAMYSQTTKWAYGSRANTARPTSGPWKRPVSAVVSENLSIATQFTVCADCL